jgi:hypothetical protein
LESVISGIEYCVFNGDEQEKDKVIKIKVDEILHRNQVSVEDSLSNKNDLALAEVAAD